MDKRDLSTIFRERLKLLLTRSDLNQSAFAAAVGIDRSALSQLLSGASTRLPRAETLLNIAAELQGVARLAARPQPGRGRRPAKSARAWRSRKRTAVSTARCWPNGIAEAAGTKIRYVPAGIPDLLRTEALVDYEAGITNTSREAQAGETQYRIDYNRRPETDMEVCMPRHTLEIFARGLGVWDRFPGGRPPRSSLPTWRRCSTISTRPSACFSMTGGMRYSVPYTIFGPYRAAIYVGDMYLVLNATAADPDADPPFRQSDPRRRHQRRTRRPPSRARLAEHAILTRQLRRRH